MLGKKGDFSGRMPVWRAITEVWADSPVGGYGWGALWPYSWFHPEVNYTKGLIDQKAGLWYSHGHNSVLDILPQIGLVGAASLVVVVVLAIRWVFVPVDEAEYATVRWIALGTLGFLVYGITEPMVAIPVSWFLLVVIAAGSQRLARGRGLVV